MNTKVTFSVPADAAAKIMNNPKAFMDYLKEHGFPVEEVYLNKESIYDLCPACNSVNKTVLPGRVNQCADCGGLYGRVMRHDANKYVKLKEMARECRDQFYFDFTYIDIDLNDQRVHGWACCDTKNVVQWG